MGGAKLLGERSESRRNDRPPRRAILPGRAFGRPGISTVTARKGVERVGDGRVDDEAVELDAVIERRLEQVEYR